MAADKKNIPLFSKRILAQPQKGAVRYDVTGKITAMASADGYVMVRRPGAPPFVMPLKTWHRMAIDPVITGTEGQIAT